MRFFSVTKPGIIMGNAITMSGGYFLAVSSPSQTFLVWHWLATLIGMALVIACGCVFNNFLDQDIDQLMERTKQRVIPQGQISGPISLIYAGILGAAGLFTLKLVANGLTVFIAIIGLVVYIIAYSLWLKRTSVYGTLIGGIAGAVPPVVGYTAVTAQIDSAAVSLFLILFFWQVPHSYAIAIFRLKDYQAASIPVLPVVKSLHHTQIVMIIYSMLFACATLLPFILGYKGWYYLVVVLIMDTVWLSVAISGFWLQSVTRWARRLFALSILHITLLCVAMAIEPIGCMIVSCI